MIDREMPGRGKGRELTCISDELGNEKGHKWLVWAVKFEFVCVCVCVFMCPLHRKVLTR